MAKQTPEPTTGSCGKARPTFVMVKSREVDESSCCHITCQERPMTSTPKRCRPTKRNGPCDNSTMNCLITAFQSTTGCSFERA